MSFHACPIDVTFESQARNMVRINLDVYVVVLVASESVYEWPSAVAVAALRVCVRRPCTTLLDTYLYYAPITIDRIRRPNHRNVPGNALHIEMCTLLRKKEFARIYLYRCYLFTFMY